MPNYSENQLHFDCSEEDFEQKIKPLLSGTDHHGEPMELTFNVLVPMPAHIYRGNVGEKERAIYGKDNWYDWSWDHWGTKWDAFDASVEPSCVQFTTAWNQPEEWYEALAAALKPLGITAHADYYNEGGFPGSLGGYDFEDGHLIPTEADPEFAKIWEYDEEEEE